MIGTHGQRDLPPPLHHQQFLDYADHIHVAVKMIGFEKFPLKSRFVLRRWMKADMVPKPADHSRQIVIRPYPITARTKTKPIGR